MAGVSTMPAVVATVGRPLGWGRKAAARGSQRAAPPVKTIVARKRVIDGATKEMNAIASRNLDFAPARRYVRDAFAGAQQRLDHFLFKMAPAGIQMEERYEMNSKGLEIFWKSWLPRPGIPIKGTLFFCHGYGDTCTFFFEGIGKMIANEGYAVYAMDYPGFGLSDGLHGYIPNFDELVDHVIEQYTRIRATHALRGLPHFLLGQSMGGAVALKVHLKQTKEWDGVILVAPMCKISKDIIPSPPVLKALTILSYFLPQAKLFPSQDIGELAFRDPEKRKMAEYNVVSYSDKLRLKTAIELLKATQDVESQVEKVSSPLLVLHGAADKVTDPTVSKFLYDTACSQDKTMKIYDGGYHSILEGEPDERISTVISDIVSWRSEGSPLDLNNLPEEYGKQTMEESSTTTATSANSTRFKKKKCGKEGKEESGNVYECRFCSLKFCKSQALGGHMNRHRQERETETLNRARQLVFSNDGFATVGAHMGLRDLNFGGSGQAVASFPRGGGVGDTCLHFRPVYPMLPTRPPPPTTHLQQYVYPPQASPRTLPYQAPFQLPPPPPPPPAGDYYVGRVLAGSPHSQPQSFGGAAEANRVRLGASLNHVVMESGRPPTSLESAIGSHAYGLRTSDPPTDPF